MERARENKKDMDGDRATGKQSTALLESTEDTFTTESVIVYLRERNK